MIDANSTKIAPVTTPMKNVAINTTARLVAGNLQPD
jgi:hypothetical protein